MLWQTDKDWNYVDIKDLKGYGKSVGAESSRTFNDKVDSGFFNKYMLGNGLDIGGKGYSKYTVLPILPGATIIDLDYPDYDGIRLPFNDESQDYVYSSHCLEHIFDYKETIKEWHRVTKVNGFIIITVPHMYLYEKKWDIPSKWNGDHKRFYTPGSLIIEIENSLQPNSYRVRLLEDGDKGFNYELGPDIHSDGQYEITLVIEKIKKPTWDLL